MEKEKKIPGVCLTPQELTLLGFHDVVKGLAAGREYWIYFRAGEDHPAFVSIQESRSTFMRYRYEEILEMMREVTSDGE